MIYRNRERYLVSVMYRFFEVSRSGYDDFVHRLERKKKDEGEGCRFGGSYPRSARALLQDIWISTDVAVVGETRHAPQSKTILRIMKKYGLWAEIRRRRKWVQVRQQLHKYENLLKRPFQADRPNNKWVTDISYIHTKEGVLYLSMIRDLYDNSIVAYKTGTQQTVNLVLDTIRLAMMKEKKRVAATL